MKKVILITLSVVFLLSLVLGGWVLYYPELAHVKTPSGRRRSESLYVTMEDGVRIAVEIWYPSELREDDKIPAVIQATRYGIRSLSALRNLPFPVKMQIRMGKIPQWLVPYYQIEQEADMLNKAGYAVILMDMRGSAASFGTRPIEWAPREIQDMGEIMDWIISQPWSNGNIGAYGSSYPGNTAELAASLNHPALKAVAPESSDFDPLLGVGMPGGLRTDNFVKQWSDHNQAIDEDISHGRVVDADKSGELLKLAYESHDSQIIKDALMAIEFRDDKWGDSGLTMNDVSPFALKNEIEESAVPMYVTAGWHDAVVADGAISRFLTFSNSQEVYIGPWAHGRGVSSDPLLGQAPLQGDTVEEKLEFFRNYFAAKEVQILTLINFFDRHLKTDQKGEPSRNNITYYTLGADSWTTTDVWPPEGVSDRTYYFSSGQNLATDKPKSPEGDDIYNVDFSASTGTFNRWMTQFGTYLDYTADRSEEDKKLLVYTGKPFAQDTIIIGNPVVTLYVNSSESDCAFHVYLEDVAPDGKVTYLTEGVLRSIHRPVSEEEAPFKHPGVAYSFNREDSRPMVPGQIEEIPFNLNAISALIKKGHSIRVAIGGADASVFPRQIESNDLQWQIMRNRDFSSSISLPIASR